MSANDRQVGGDHYKSEYIHWDLVILTGMGYLEGNATKYIARAHKKGRAQEDLEKALHYIEKLSENANICSLRPVMPYALINEEVARFCDLNQLGILARTAMFTLVLWQSRADLANAASTVQAMLRALPKTVPLEDSNKHATRADSDSD